MPQPTTTRDQASTNQKLVDLDQLDHLRAVVLYLDGVNVSMEKASAITAATVKLVAAFNASQA